MHGQRSAKNRGWNKHQQHRSICRSAPDLPKPLCALSFSFLPGMSRQMYLRIAEVKKEEAMAALQAAMEADRRAEEAQAATAWAPPQPVQPPPREGPLLLPRGSVAEMQEALQPPWHVRSWCDVHARIPAVPSPHTVHGTHSPSHWPAELFHVTGDAASLNSALHSHTPASFLALLAGQGLAVPSRHGAAFSSGE